MAHNVSVNGVAVAACAVGLMFIWSGVKGTSFLASAQALVQGKQPPKEQTLAIEIPTDSTAASDTGSGTTLAKGGTVAQNQTIGKMLAASYGWSTGAEWDALVWVWDHESGWRNTAENPSSGAYGIPQALPPTKMPKAARPPKLGGTSDTGAQISWGLNYIKSRYGSPTKAKAFWQSHNWY